MIKTIKILLFTVLIFGSANLVVLSADEEDDVEERRQTVNKCIKTAWLTIWTVI